QNEFNFCSDGSLLDAPPLEIRATCCNKIPLQHDHPEFYARCFADEPSARRLMPVGWPRPDFRPVVSVKRSADPPKKPKAPEVESQAPRANQESNDEYDSNT